MVPPSPTLVVRCSWVIDNIGEGSFAFAGSNPVGGRKLAYPTTPIDYHEHENKRAG